MTSAGNGTKKNVADPLTLEDENQLWSSGRLSYTECLYSCEVFGFRALKGLVNFIVEQDEFGLDVTGIFVKYHGRVAKKVQCGLAQLKVDVKSIKQHTQVSNAQCG